MIEPKVINAINQAILQSNGNKIDNGDCSSCLSSYSYYDTIEEQIASIVYNIVKNHYFVDGNKRTAYVVLIKLCEDNNVRLNNKDKADIINEIASKKMDISQVVELLFH